jgi:ubiquitin-protein ligase
MYIFPNRIRIDIEGAAATLYDGEKFQLLFKFSDQYPFDSPQVIKANQSLYILSWNYLGYFHWF